MYDIVHITHKAQKAKCTVVQYSQTLYGLVSKRPSSCTEKEAKGYSIAECSSMVCSGEREGRVDSPRWHATIRSYSA